MAAPPPLDAFYGQRRRWRVAAAPPASELAMLGEVDALLAALLYHRGLRTETEAREFLAVSPTLLQHPGTLPGIDSALARFALARERGETVAVYGDFDADGVTGTALLVRALTRFGVVAIPYIPHRVTEGHGLNEDAVRLLHGRGVRLIVTVDCGVGDTGPVVLAGQLGIDVVITDHHATTAPLPPAVAVVNPRAPGSAYPFDELTGVGMALKLAQFLLEPEHGAGWDEGLLELAAIGTITDMAPLVHENRYIVHHGIRQLRRTRTPGLRALLDGAGITTEQLDAEDIGFGIGPRLNAAGRLAHAMTAYDLLTTEDPAEAAQLATQLEAHNTERRRLTEEALERSRELADLQGAARPIVVGSPDFSPGVVGLVAGRLAEERGVPVAVYALDGGLARASCRGGPEFHWAHALAACDLLLTRYGGHRQAAGFTCAAERIDELSARLGAIADEWLAEHAPSLDGHIDAEVRIIDLMGSTLTAVRTLGPFGIGNPTPVFLTRGVEVESASVMGSARQHLRLRIRAHGAIWDAVAFRQELAPGLERAGFSADIVYTMEVRRFGAQSRLRLNVQDYAPAGRLL